MVEYLVVIWLDVERLREFSHGRTGRPGHQTWTYFFVDAYLAHVITVVAYLVTHISKHHWSENRGNVFLSTLPDLIHNR